jgi:hypothetical protein
MKILFPMLFFLMGCLFLLVGTAFYPAISELLLNIEKQITPAAPSFWDLSFVLGFVRVIFIIVGVFLIGLGIGFFFLKRH